MDSSKNIIFSGTFLSLNNNPLSIEEFKESIPENTYSIPESKRVHVYKFSYQEKYLKVTFGDGSAMPRNPNVIDIKTNETLPNPRQPNQVEPRETFGIIDFKTGFLWLSNSKKRNSLLDFFRSKFKKANFASKDVYDEEKFIQTLKRLDDIRVSAAPNLFSQSNVLSERLSEEINGYEASVASLNFHYHDKWVGENLVDKIKSIFKHKNNFNGIVISGRDENNLGMLFNSEGFSRKIEFNAPVDNNEMFMPEEVFSRLINKIEDENN
jgi:hypothetical protein